MYLLIESKVFGRNTAKVIMTGKKSQEMFFGSQVNAQSDESHAVGCFLGMGSLKEINIQKRCIKTRNVGESRTKRDEKPF